MTDQEPGPELPTSPEARTGPARPPRRDDHLDDHFDDDHFDDDHFDDDHYDADQYDQSSWPCWQERSGSGTAVR